MQRKRNIIKIISIFIVLFCYFFVEKNTYANAKASDSNIKILLVIDESGSLKKEEKVITKTLDILYNYLLEKGLYNSIEAIAFSDTARQIKADEITKLKMKEKNTCILVGLEQANEWVQKQIKVSKEKICVIVISDLVEDPGILYEINMAQEKQKEVNEIVKKWEGYRKEDKLEYLFITWRKKESEGQEKIFTLKELEDNNVKKIEKFWCEILEKQNVYCLNEKGENKKEEIISQVEMTGRLLKKLVEILTETETKKLRKEVLKNGENIKINKFCEGYIITEGNAILINEETQKEINSIYNEQNINIFYMGMDMNDKKIQIKTQNKMCEIFGFYIPIAEPIVVIKPKDDIRINKEFEIICKIEDNHLKQKIIEPLQIQIYKNNVENKHSLHLKKMYFNDKEEYVCSFIIEEAGIYSYEIRMGDGFIIKKGNNISIKESKEQTERIVNNDIKDNSKFESKKFIINLLKNCGKVLIVLIALIAIIGFINIRK